MAVIKPQEDMDQYTAELLEAAQKTVAEEIAELQAAGIPIYYHEYPGGPLIQELPDGTKVVVAPARHD